MSSTMLDLLDTLKLKMVDSAVGLIEEFSTYAPELSMFPARTLSGIDYKTAVRVARPSAAFGDVNGGYVSSKSRLEPRMFQCYNFGGTLEIPYGTASVVEGGMPTLQMMEAAGLLEESALKIGSQVYYGTSADAKGFPGFIDSVHADMVVDATGSTAKTSAWLVKFGVQNVQLLFGRDNILTLDDWVDKYDKDATTLKTTKLSVNQLTGWIGLQVLSKFSLCRIKNIGTDTGKGMTDDLVLQAINKAPAGYQYDAVVMNKRSAEQHRVSRKTTINTNPQEPTPTTSHGLKIIISDSITNSET